MYERSTERAGSADPAFDAMTVPGATPFLETPRDADTSVDRLLAVIDTHASAEVEALEAYREMRDAGDPLIALIMQIILDDEERHHTLLRRISASLRDALNWSQSPEALPTGSEPSPPVSPAMIATARELIQEEHTGAGHLRQLAHSERNINSGLDSTLLEMMATDSQKHAQLLEFVAHRLQARSKAAQA